MDIVIDHRLSSPFVMTPKNAFKSESDSDSESELVCSSFIDLTQVSFFCINGAQHLWVDTDASCVVEIPHTCHTCRFCQA